MTPLIAASIKLTPDAEAYHWFDIGDLGTDLEMLDGRDPIASRLPYQRCAVTFLEGGDPVTLFCRYVDGAIHITGFVALPDGIRQIKKTTIHHAANGYFGKGGDDEELKAVLVTIVYWLRQLDKGGVAYTITPKAAHINQKRKAKGKGPLMYSWHTIELKPTAPQANPAGGTHASPRMHDRRGHWRTYPSGKRGWVRDCKVGDASKGTVFKDYKT